jgi:hypothetical protein
MIWIHVSNKKMTRRTFVLIIMYQESLDLEHISSAYAILLAAQDTDNYIYTFIPENTHYPTYFRSVTSQPIRRILHVTI